MSNEELRGEIIAQSSVIAAGESVGALVKELNIHPINAAGYLILGVIDILKKMDAHAANRLVRSLVDDNEDEMISSFSILLEQYEAQCDAMEATKN